MTSNILLIEGYPEDAVVLKLCTIADEEAPFPIEIFERRLKHQPHILGCYAYDKDELVGYKIGYESRPRYFESWMGAIAPAYRGQGIARELMSEQHHWCEEKGYRIITTITDGSNTPMLILNLKAGFVISGTQLDRGENHQVLLQKWIVEEGDT